MSNFKPILILSLFVLFMVSLGAISAEDVNVTVISDSQVDNSVYVDSNIVANGNGTLLIIL